jgi:hypothetical protein
MHPLPAMLHRRSDAARFTSRWARAAVLVRCTCSPGFLTFVKRRATCAVIPPTLAQEGAWGSHGSSTASRVTASERSARSPKRRYCAHRVQARQPTRIHRPLWLFNLLLREFRSQQGALHAVQRAVQPTWTTEVLVIGCQRGTDRPAGIACRTPSCAAAMGGPERSANTSWSRHKPGSISSQHTAVACRGTQEQWRFEPVRDLMSP